MKKEEMYMTEGDIKGYKIQHPKRTAEEERARIVTYIRSIHTHPKLAEILRTVAAAIEQKDHWSR